MYRDFQRSQTMADTCPEYHPDENAATTLLQYMTKEQLEEFLNKPERVESHISDLEQVKGFKRDRENVVVRNKSLAEYNISMQPKFESLKQNVARSYEEVNELKFALTKDIAKLDSLQGSASHDTMLAIFQTEAATADEQSEEIAEEFINGNVDIDTFINEYVSKRTDAYKKRAKLEKVGDLFRQGSTSTNVAPYPSQSSPYSGNSVPGKQQTPSYANAGYSGSSTPYPSNNPYMGMPMPPSYPR